VGNAESRWCSRSSLRLERDKRNSQEMFTTELARWVARSLCEGTGNDTERSQVSAVAACGSWNLYCVPSWSDGYGNHTNNLVLLLGSWHSCAYGDSVRAGNARVVACVRWCRGGTTCPVECQPGVSPAVMGEIT